MGDQQVGPGRSENALGGLGPGTTALVTGGAGAIGRGVAGALVEMGVCVAVMSRNPTQVERVAGDLGQRAIAATGDVGSARDAERAVRAVVREWGHLDVVVHAAAVTEGVVRLDDLTPDQIETVLRVNIVGAIHIAQAAARAMRESGGGRIVNAGSVAAHQALPGRVAYGSSKAGLIQLTRQLAVELGPDGIAANSVSPGQTPTVLRSISDTPGQEPRPKLATSGETPLDRIPLGRRGVVADFVGPILFLASDLAGYVTGIDLVVDGGAMAMR